MVPLFREPQYTFRFAEDRLVPRFHLEGLEAGRAITLWRIVPATSERIGWLAAGTVGSDGWVDLPEPLLMRGGEAFIAVPESVA